MHNLEKRTGDFETQGPHGDRESLLPRGPTLLPKAIKINTALGFVP